MEWFTGHVETLSNHPKHFTKGVVVMATDFRKNASRAFTDVCAVFLAHPGAVFAGSDIREATGLKPGSLYPMLEKMVANNWLEAFWEDLDPRVFGARPRRMLVMKKDAIPLAQKTQKKN